MAASTLPTDLDATIDRIAGHPFRAKFHLRARERACVELRGMEPVREHAHDFIAKRLAPAQPAKDYVVDVICRWVERESAAAGRTPPA